MSLCYSLSVALSLCVGICFLYAKYVFMYVFLTCLCDWLWREMGEIEGNVCDFTFICM